MQHTVLQRQGEGGGKGGGGLGGRIADIDLYTSSALFAYVALPVLSLSVKNSTPKLPYSARETKEPCRRCFFFPDARSTTMLLGMPVAEEQGFAGQQDTI